jgi:hypothetical protein
MTIVVNIVVPEGIVFTADSRQTYTNRRGDVRVGSDYGRKLFPLGPRAAAVCWGWAFLHGRNIHSHVNDYKVTLGDKSPTVEEMAKGLGEYLNQQYKTHLEKGYDKPVEAGNYAMALLIGGYDVGQKSGKVYEVYVPDGESYLRRTTDESPGAGWRGNNVVISRLIKGFDPRLRELPGISPELTKALDESKLDYNVDYWSMPLQDAVDLATFLVHTTIQMLRFSDGISMQPGASANCGGPIDIAVVEPNQGFAWVQNKELRGERATSLISNSET